MYFKISSLYSKLWSARTIFQHFKNQAGFTFSRGHQKSHLSTFVSLSLLPSLKFFLFCFCSQKAYGRVEVEGKYKELNTRTWFFFLLTYSYFALLALSVSKYAWRAFMIGKLFHIVFSFWDWLLNSYHCFLPPGNV